MQVENCISNLGRYSTRLISLEVLGQGIPIPMLGSRFLRLRLLLNSVPLQRLGQGILSDLLQLQDPLQQLLAILEAQIRSFEATVLYVQDINWLPAAFLRHVKSYVELW